MSRTDNTVPYRLWAQYGLTYHDSVRIYRCGAQRRSIVKPDVVASHRRGRRQAREALRRGETPEPYRPRNQAHWNAL